MNADGSNAAMLTDAIFDSTKEASHRWPNFLPDGDHFLFWAGNFQNASDDTTSGIYFSSLEAKRKTLVAVTRSNPGYSSGYVYYVDERKALLAASMDVSDGRVAGEPLAVAEGAAINLRSIGALLRWRRMALWSTTPEAGRFFPS